MNKVQRLNKEEILKRLADNWYKFHNRLHGTTYAEFVKEGLEEYERQNKLSDKDLVVYREKGFKDSVNETRNTYKGENEIYDRKEEQFNNKTSNKQNDTGRIL